MSVDLFIDTNILVYAHDLSAGGRHKKALQLIQDLWKRRERPLLSIQVLQELHVTMVRKGVDADASREVVANYLQWRVIENSKAVFRKALENQAKWQLSFWDASILSAAQQGGAAILWSEDFNLGQVYEGVKVVNPLL